MFLRPRDERPAKSDPTISERLHTHRALSGVPQAELDWLIERGTIGHYLAGDQILHKGDEVNDLLIVLKGQLTHFTEQGGTWRKAMSWREGDITGVLPYSRVAVSPGNSFMDEPTEAFFITREYVNELPRTCPHLTGVLVHTMIDRARAFKSSDLEGEKLATMGRLAAGLAHELNNPASAATSAAKHLAKALAESEAASRALGAAQFSDAELAVVERVRGLCADGQATSVLSPLQFSDREESIAEWLGDHDVDDTFAAALAETDVSLAALDEMARTLSAEKIAVGIRWMAAGCTVRGLVRDIERASSRVHELVGSVKRVTYMDRATAPEAIDMRQGLTDTLAMLAHKARKKSASATVDAPEDLPRVLGIGGELNQVWMNLIDNALDAVNEGGRVTVTARSEGKSVVVRVTDDGPGIPEEIKRRIWDPFFTTKPVGQGTGMGLEIARKLVTSNNGRIDVESQPGKTEFRVALPVAR